MLKIRLFRTGCRNNPFYRIVVTDSRRKRDGRFVEIIGHCQLTPKHLDESSSSQRTPASIKKDRWDHWIKQGAQPSDGIRKLIAQEKLLP